MTSIFTVQRLSEDVRYVKEKWLKTSRISLFTSVYFVFINLKRIHHASSKHKEKIVPNFPKALP